VIRIEATSESSVRVIGALSGTALSGLVGTWKDREVVLDLSEVCEADAAAVRMLGLLPASRLVNCPRWLALWIERERQPLAPDVGLPETPERRV
jgi:hypothetical protein